MSLVNTLKSLIMLEIDSHVNLEKHVMNTCKTAFYHLRNIECFHSRGQHICKFIGTKERVCIRKEFNSQRTGLGHQHGRRFIVLGHQYGRRDVMWEHSIAKIRNCLSQDNAETPRWNKLFHLSWISVMLFYMAYLNQLLIGYSMYKTAQPDWWLELEAQNI